MPLLREVLCKWGVRVRTQMTLWKSSWWKTFMTSWAVTSVLTSSMFIANVTPFAEDLVAGEFLLQEKCIALYTTMPFYLWCAFSFVSGKYCNNIKITYYKFIVLIRIQKWNQHCRSPTITWKVTCSSITLKSLIQPMMLISFLYIGTPCEKLC